MSAQVIGDPVGSFDKHMEYMRENIRLTHLVEHLQAKIKCMHRELYALAPEGYTNPDEIQGSTSN